MSTYNQAAGRPASPFDVAPAAASVPTATLNRNAILNALHIQGISDDEAQVVLAAIIAGALPLVTYSGA